MDLRQQTGQRTRRLIDRGIVLQQDRAGIVGQRKVEPVFARQARIARERQPLRQRKPIDDGPRVAAEAGIIGAAPA